MSTKPTTRTPEENPRDACSGPARCLTRILARRVRVGDPLQPGRPHTSLGPGIPDPSPDLNQQISAGHHVPARSRVVAKPILNGLHHASLLPPPSFAAVPTAFPVRCREDASQTAVSSSSVTCNLGDALELDFVFSTIAFSRAGTSVPARRAMKVDPIVSLRSE